MILVIAAMEEEYQELLVLMKDSVLHQDATLKYTKGYINNKEVILMLSGVGKVNAAYTFTKILNKFDISFVLNIGSAGGLRNQHHVNVLDIVIAKKVCYHDVDLTLANRKPGVLPDLPQYFNASLNDKMIETLKDIDLSIHYATIASGDQFVHEISKLEYITNTFEDVCAVEMEAGAIAHICYLNKIPFVIFRSISDVVGEKDNNQIQFDQYIKQASKNSARVAYEIISKVDILNEIS